MMSTYIINTPEQWNQWLTDAGADGAAKIRTKLEFVRSYMLDSWNIDLDELREVVLRRTSDILADKVDLEDLTI